MTTAGPGLPAEVAVAGLGNMGGAIARRLAASGVRVRGFDPGLPPSRVQVLRDAGVEVVASAAELVAGTDVLALVLPDSAAVTGFLDDAADALARGATVVDLSTGYPSEAATVQRGLAQRGVAYLSAPVLLGSAAEAASGQLVLALAGPQDAATALAPLLEVLSSSIERFERIEQPLTVKILNNLVALATSALLAEAVAAGRTNGLADERLLAVLASASSGRWVAMDHVARVAALARQPQDVTFGVRLAAKDLGYARRLSADAGLEHDLADAAHTVYDRAATAGGEAGTAPWRRRQQTTVEKGTQMARAAQYVAAGSMALATVPAPQPGPHEVAISVAFAGICGTDLHIFHGDMDQRVAHPVTIGHEMSGTVAAVGDGVTACAIGDRVTVMPIRSCGECASCRAGHPNVCPSLIVLGIDAPGAMQELWVVPEANVVRLPDDADLRVAALIEPVAVAVHDVRRAELSAGENVLVVGGGPVGVLIALVARLAGTRVVVAEINEHRRALAAGLGLTTVDPAVEDAQALRKRLAPDGFDVAFEVSGSTPGVALATDALSTHGRLAVIAIHSAPRPVDLHQFFWRELTLSGSRLYERFDFERAARLVTSGHLPAAGLISRVESLEHSQDALVALSDGGALMKVLIACSPEAAAEVVHA